MTITEFLLARIDEDEATAKAAMPGPWTVSPSKYVAGHYVHRDVANGEQVGHATQTTKVNAAHIARHDPRRVLAECEAKRRIVEECDASNRLLTLTDNPRSDHRDWLLRVLAAVYADHPDYRDEWRP